MPVPGCAGSALLPAFGAKEASHLEASYWPMGQMFLTFWGEVRAVYHTPDKWWVQWTQGGSKWDTVQALRRIVDMIRQEMAKGLYIPDSG
jgi:hypothetical protein